MIVFPEKQKLIITPPHTASGNMHNSLCVNEYGGKWVIHENYAGLYDQHGAQIATGWDGYQIACVWRDPKDRLIGLWNHYIWGYEHGFEQKRTFREFIQQIVNDKGYWMYRWTIARLLQKVRRVHKWIMFDNLEADVSEFVEQPWSCPSAYPRYHHPEITPEIESLMEDWFEEDYRLLRRKT